MPEPGCDQARDKEKLNDSSENAARLHDGTDITRRHENDVDRKGQEKYAPDTLVIPLRISAIPNHSNRRFARQKKTEHQKPLNRK